jgi:hypothetical protein
MTGRPASTQAIVPPSMLTTFVTSVRWLRFRQHSSIQKLLDAAGQRALEALRLTGGNVARQHLEHAPRNLSWMRLGIQRERFRSVGDELVLRVISRCCLRE